MDCRETQKRMKSFIDGDMNPDDTLDFVDHIESCPECREELTIQFLVTEGVSRLEKGGAFDLNKELEERIQKSGAKAQAVSNFRFGMGLVTMISVFAVAMVLIKVFLL